MKFTKFGKALLTGALSAGVIFGVSSCIQSYTVGYLYVTGTVTAQPNGNGIVTGYKIDHNTGQLVRINGLPVSSGGANPVRAVLASGSRFLYVLNRGVNSSGSGDCTTADPCQNSNITQYAVGGNGMLTPQQVFYTQGINPFRLAVDGSGSFLMVLDHDAPSSAACQAALGSGVSACGDITLFAIDSRTGRLSLVQNAQVSSAGGAPLSYFPVPANPVDFAITSAYVLTLTGNSASPAFPYTGGANVFPYAFNPGSGQLTLNQNTVQPLGIAGGNAIVNASGLIYVLDNEPLSYTSNNTTVTALSQILPFTVGSNGALQAETSGKVPSGPGQANPIQLMVESKGIFVYVANDGNNLIGPNGNSGIDGYFITTNPAFQLSFTSLEPYGSGSGPQCIVEDPSNQFIYTANYYDSTVTGQVLDPNSGVLNKMVVASSYALPGPATWCLVDGRTS
ncbi:MAG: beta-propeller fold lactonase family protein [Acidobacteriota bacterium]